MLKKELYHRSSCQILIISSTTHHVSFLFKLFFNYLIFTVEITKFSSPNVSQPRFTIKSWVTCKSKFNMFLSWILKTYMTDVLRTSPERPIIWSQGRPTIGSRRRPVDIPIHIFWIFVFPVKTSNRCVKQRLLHLKNTFFIKSCKAKTIASKKRFFH